MASAPAAERRIGNVDRAEDVGLDALAPVALEDRHVLERGGMEHDVRLELRHQAHDALAVADVGDPPFDRGRRAVRRERFRDRVERRLGILHDQEARGAEGDDALADLGPDRAAAAGDDHRLALDQRFEPRIVDLLARPQQEVLDRDGREARRVAALQRGHAVDDHAQLARRASGSIPDEPPARTRTASSPGVRSACRAWRSRRRRPRCRRCRPAPARCG